MYSNDLVAWIYLFEFEDTKGNVIKPIMDEKDTSKAKSYLVTQKGSTQIHYLNKRQALVQSINGFCIIDLSNGNLQFKFVFTGYLNVDLTVSQNAVAIPRKQDGAIIDIGCIRNAEAHFSQAEDYAIYNDMNHIYHKFYDLFFKLTKGYLKITEMNTEWYQSKLMPVQVMRSDYMERDEETQVIGDFHEFTLITLTYNCRFDIAEATIRAAIIDNRLPITDHQLSRVFSPVLSDNNKSVLHHICARRLDQLTHLFTKTNIESCVNMESHRFPFFLDFEKKSPFNYAIELGDTESLKFLVQKLVEYQNSFFSAYLIDGWLLKAMKMDIDLNILFESKLCTCNLQDLYSLGFNDFPEFHSDKSTITEKYVGNISDLNYDKKLYQQVFPSIPYNSGSTSAREGNSLISYDIDFFFIMRRGTMHSERQDSLFDYQKEFIQILASQKSPRLFQTKFVQRFLDYHWKNGYRQILQFNFAIYCIIIVLILACSVLTSYPDGTDEAFARKIMLSVNAFLVLGYVPAYEIKQMTQQGCSYFSSWKNASDVMFVLIFVATLVFEWKVGTTEDDSELYEVTRILYAFLCPFGFIKLLDSMRTYNNVSFLVRMLTIVFLSLTNFLTLYFFMILVFMFAHTALGLHFDTDEDRNDTAYTSGIGGLAYFFFILRTSLGDFDVDPYSELPLASQFIIWTMWMLTVGVNTIIFLNFLIAVISDVYEQIMSTKKEEIFLKKAELLLEINEIVGDWAMAKCVSSIYITRAPKEIKQKDEWSGFFQELRQHITKKTNHIDYQLTKSTLQLTNSYNEKHRETMQAIQRVERVFDRFNATVDSRLNQDRPGPTFANHGSPMNHIETLN